MKVLFIGGTGIISSAVSKLALEKGIDLYLFNRNNRKELIPEGAKIIQGDIRREDEAREILKDYSFDVVVNWIAFTPEHIETDLRLFRDKTNQYIFISSTSIYKRPPESFIVNEKTPVSNPFWEYSQNKIACEELLFDEHRKNGFPVTVVRPAHTYGNILIPHIFNSHKSRWSIVERMKRGKKIIVPGDGTSLWVLTYNADFAKGFIGILGNPKTIGEVYQITSDEVVTWNQITDYIGEAAGVKPDIVHISTDFITACVPWIKGELVGDLINSVCYDNSKIKELVPDFKAATPVREGLKETVDWYMKHPELQWLDEEWDMMCDRLIAAHEAGIAAYKAGI